MQTLAKINPVTKLKTVYKVLVAELDIQQLHLSTGHTLRNLTLPVGTEVNQIKFDGTYSQFVYLFDGRYYRGRSLGEIR